MPEKTTKVSRGEPHKPTSPARTLNHRPSLGQLPVSSTTSVSEAAKQNSDRRRNGSHAWMKKFCVEPAGDAGTCCLGFWLPCLLYGKIDDRLSRVRDGRDPQKVGNGCNSSCLIWWIACYGFCGGMTANRRTRVRGLYDIDGKIAKDCVIGFFCNQCTLMQSDREIRAREADINLNVLKMGGKPKTVSRQPGTRPEMSYAPPDSGIINLDRLNDENRNVQAPLNSPGKKLQKYYQPMSPKSNQATPVDPQDIQIVVHPADRNEGDIESRHMVYHGPDANPKGVLQISSDLPRPQMVDSSASKQRSAPTASAQEKGLKSIISEKAKDFVDFFNIDQSWNRSTKSGPESKFADHELCTCPTADSERQVKPTWNQQVLGRGDHLARTAGTQKSSLSQAQKEANTPAKAASPVSKGLKHELSYVHDFTGSDVDRDVLKHYEQEEAHSQADSHEELCTCSNGQQEASSDAPSKFKIAQAHRLSECSHDETVQSSNGQVAKQQDGIAEEHRAGTTNIVPEEPLGLDEAIRNDQSSSRENQPVRRRDSARRRSTLADLMNEIEQHSLKDCTRVSSVSVLLADKPKRDPSFSCCDDDPVITVIEENAQDGSSEPIETTTKTSSDLKIPKQHDLGDCNRSNSLNALEVNKLKQNTQNRSSSLNMARSKTVHELKDCSRLSSILEILPEKTGGQHAIQDCTHLTPASEDPVDDKIVSQHKIQDCESLDPVTGKSAAQQPNSKSEEKALNKRTTTHDVDSTNVLPELASTQQSNPHVIQDCPQLDSIVNPATKNAEKMPNDLLNKNPPTTTHTIQQCTKLESLPEGPSKEQGHTKQHEKLDKKSLGSHGIQECTRLDSLAEEAVKHESQIQQNLHALAECTRTDSVAIPRRDDHSSLQHDIFDCDEYFLTEESINPPPCEKKNNKVEDQVQWSKEEEPLSPRTDKFKIENTITEKSKRKPYNLTGDGGVDTPARSREHSAEYALARVLSVASPRKEKPSKRAIGTMVMAGKSGMKLAPRQAES